MEKELTKLVPRVIDEKMLVMGSRAGAILSTESEKSAAGAIFREEGVAWDSVQSLVLEFKEICLITNLWNFRNLKSLDLSNNLIQEICGLETLHKLQKLNLSFNYITKIQGLQTLTDIQDLSLYENKIEVLENLDELKKLRIFSIGNNQLSSISNILYLRKFADLRGLTLKGNPISEQANYFSYVVSHLEQITFFDYRYLLDSEREDALEQNRIAVETLTNEEKRFNKVLQKQREEEEKRNLLTLAFVDVITSPLGLLDFFGIPETVKQKCALDNFEELFGPIVGKTLSKFWEEGKKVLLVAQEKGLKAYQVRNSDVHKIKESFSAIDKESRDEATRLMEAFKEDFRENIKGVEEIFAARGLDRNTRKSEAESSRSPTSASNEESPDDEQLSQLAIQVLELSQSSCEEIRSSLFALEFRAAGELDNALKIFDKQMTSSKEALVSLISKDLQKVLRLAQELEKSLRNLNAAPAVEEGNDEETSNNFMPLMCDLHMAQQSISSYLDEFASRLTFWQKEVVDEITKSSETRHRRRIGDIVSFSERHLKKVDDLRIALDIANAESASKGLE
ncbi:unnamed protein product [Notodromas monacha]|uniref:Dynein axonemal assembly factor 1 homolog n=1 Tax=Notodromas monacha TaxID=399045 RepID=A0A7R9GHJ2_9CRUS|nr:unnamed protein product [Notodromas monacha]CAG0921405.1 unnamed protein product [Notodromas monacha]